MPYTSDKNACFCTLQLSLYHNVICMNMYLDLAHTQQQRSNTLGLHLGFLVFVACEAEQACDVLYVDVSCCLSSPCQSRACT